MPQQRDFHMLYREDGTTSLYYTVPCVQAHFVVYESDSPGLSQKPNLALAWCVEALAQARQALLAYKEAERLEDIALSNTPPVPGSADDWRRWNDQRTEATRLMADWLSTYGDT